MRIAVVGAGGVGGYFGARLAAAGNDVTFVARGRHLTAIREYGLLVRSPLGDLQVPSDAVVPTIADLGPADLVLVAVKFWDTEDVAAQLAHVIGPDTRVLSLQNGVHKDEALRKVLPKESIVGGACYISAAIQEPGIVVHHGTLQKLVFGEYEGHASDSLQDFLCHCREAGIDAQISDDIERLIWEKFVFLVGLSGATSIVRQPIGVIRGNPRSRALLHDLMAEAVAVGRAAGAHLDAGYAEDRLAFCDTLPAAMSSSMHHDLTQGHRLELPWLGGGVAELGERFGVSTPRNRTVADALAPYESGTPTAAA
ncbi:ketopantoate reductase family protein [Streptomyces sp. NPDC008222]|uniref:ketopantoate reductase family protein n=1 Tax=Streptomyces sp. NPDC008222 TaxID=3364820 RepID=UPI0036E91CD2